MTFQNSNTEAAAPPTRFSFYEVEDSSFLNHLKADIVVSTTTTPEKQQQQQQQQDGGSSLSSSKVVVAPPLVEDDCKEQKSNTTTTTTTTNNNNNDDDMDIHDILRSLKESELSLPGRKFSGYSSFDLEDSFVQTPMRQHHNKPPLNATHKRSYSAPAPELLLSTINTNTNTNTNTTKLPSNNNTTNSSQDKSNNNAVETVVRNALYHIRARAQRRTTHGASPILTPQSAPALAPAPILSSTTTMADVVSSSLSSNSNSEWNAQQQQRRSRMADYHQASKQQQQRREPVQTATQLDNELLSPATDVRKTISSYNLFRPHPPSSNDHPSSTMTMTTTGGGGGGPSIEFANPILSFTPGKCLDGSNNNNNNNSSSSSSSSMTTPMKPIPYPLVQPEEADDTVVLTLPASAAIENNRASSLVYNMPSTSTSTPAGNNTNYSSRDEQQQQQHNHHPNFREEEIERGVESVLVAILEHAGRKAANGEDPRRDRSDEEDDDDDDGGDIIEKAFASLFLRNQQLLTNLNLDNVNSVSSVTQAATSSSGAAPSNNAIMALNINTSVVDELLAEDDEEEVMPMPIPRDKYSIHDALTTSAASLPQDHILVDSDPDASDVYRSEDGGVLQPSNAVMENGGETSSSLLTNHNSAASHDNAEAATVFSCSISDDGMVGVETIHETEEEQNGGAVLGPLSKKMGGTTGVVLDNDNHNDNEEGRRTPTDSRISPQGALSPISPMMHSLSSAVKILNVFSTDTTASSNNNAPATTMMTMMTAKTTSTEKKPRSGSESESENDSTDVEANAIMRQLCAHLLPYGVDQFASTTTNNNSNNHQPSKGFSRWLTGIKKTWSTENQTSSSGFTWNEEDPDEPGYEISKLSKSQLRRVELEFERMIHKLRRNSERNLLLQSSPFGGRPKDTTTTTQQDDFERDLAEAETMLEMEEEKHQQQAEEQVAQAKRKKQTLSQTNQPNNANDDSDHSDSPQLSDASGETTSLDAKNPLATNPSFPSIKASGRGKLGELEIYHLPIIYKAKQTGFEPTKDLVLQPGSVLAGQYFVQSELGSAAFSTAYRCVDLTSGKKADDGEEYYDEVCLKVIKNTKDFFDQSLDEIKILELLRQTGKCHENNVIELKAYFYHKEHLVIVTELLRQNLFEFGKYIIENEEPPYFTRPRLCYIVRQCLIALDFIHNLGLVHSDIKPENILLSSYSKARVKVIDFGSSCYLTDRQSSYIQSRSYRAPEVILGLPYDGKIDIWSLGCVVAEMYTGEVTFQNDSVVSMLSRIEAICGPFPRHMVANGRQSENYFTRSGLLYQMCEDDNDSDDFRRDRSFDTHEDKKEPMFHIYTPKRTSLAVRLGFDADLMEQKRTNWQTEEKALFVDFVKRLLTIDPDARPTAAEALEHPWILSGYNISDEYILYPPEEK